MKIIDKKNWFEKQIKEYENDVGYLKEYIKLLKDELKIANEIIAKYVGSPVEPEVKPANDEKEIFEYIEELLEGDICNREDAIKNGCGRCRDYWDYRDKRLSV